MKYSNKNFLTLPLLTFPVKVNNIDIGIVGLLHKEGELEVHLSTAPNVCRLSILNLTTSAISIASDFVKGKEIGIIIFKDVLPQTKFKLQSLNYQENGDDVHVLVHELNGESLDGST